MIVGLSLLVVIGLTLAACVADWRSLRIPNWISGGIIVLFLLSFLLAPASFAPWWSHFGAGLLMLLATFAMFAAGLFGGGDAKLASALALWLGLQGIVPLVLFMGIAGGALALFALCVKKKKLFPDVASESWIGQLHADRNALPYGLAISFGFWVAIFHTPVTLQQLHELFFLIH